MAFESFIEAMLKGGLLPEEVVPDGKRRRFGTQANPASRNGWCVLFEDGLGGIYGNWETGDGKAFHYWRADAAQPFVSLAEQRVARAAICQQKQQKARDESIAYFQTCQEEGSSPYLYRKKIPPTGCRFDGSTIVIPIRSRTGEMWSVQKIYPDGSKYFYPGGKVAGCMFRIGARRRHLVVAEGWATGVSIHQATGIAVAVAFNAGNLVAVAKSLGRDVLVAADNDANGVGEKAAKASGRQYVMPSDVGDDFSDLYMRGVDIKPYFKAILQGA